MGYCITQQQCKIFINFCDKENALKEIKKLMEKVNLLGSGFSGSKGQRTNHFSWVTTDLVIKSNTLEEALDEWRWEADLDNDGNITKLSFVGEKLGDDKHLFNVLAPYIEDGSFIEMRGEDGYMWRWIFENGMCKEIEGKVTFG